MTTDHGVERALQSVNVQGAADPDRIRDVVSGRSWGQLIHKPQLLLAEGKDAGIARRPAWNSILSILPGLPESLLQQDPLLGRELLNLLTDVIGQRWLQSPAPMAVFAQFFPRHLQNCDSSILPIFLRACVLRVLASAPGDGSR